MTVVEQENLPSMVGELMTSLDEVKRYKQLARSMVDFALIMLSAIVAILFVYIITDWYQAIAGPLSQSIITPNVGGMVLSDVQGLSAAVIFIGALATATILVSTRMSRVKVGEWRILEKEGTIGAMKIVSNLDWPTVFQDIRYAKLGFIFYSILKVIVYWILTFVILELILSFALGYLHIMPNFAYDAILSLIVALFVGRKDLQKRYNQSWALDSLLWELRWFDSEFRGKAGEIGSSAPKA